MTYLQPFLFLSLFFFFIRKLCTLPFADRCAFFYCSSLSSECLLVSRQDSNQTPTKSRAWTKRFVFVWVVLLLLRFFSNLMARVCRVSKVEKEIFHVSPGAEIEHFCYRHSWPGLILPLPMKRWKYKAFRELWIPEKGYVDVSLSSP